MPADLAGRVIALEALYSVLDIVEVARASGRPVAPVAAVSFALIGRLELRWLHDQIGGLPADTRWQALARSALRDDLASQQRTLTAAVLKLSTEHETTDALLDEWETRQHAPLTRLREVLAEFKALPVLDLAMLSVALRELRTLG